MPFASRRQQRMMFARKMPFAKRWAKETPSFAALPESKDAGTTAGASLSGPGGLLATPGMGGGLRKQSKTDDYPDQSQFAGYTMEDWDDTKPDSFYHDTRSLRKRLKAALGITTKPMTPSEVGRVAALARWNKTPRKAKLPTKGRKPAQTELERAETRQGKQRERDEARAAQRAQNRADVLRSLNIAPDGAEALDKLRNGEQPDADAIARGGFVEAGLVEQSPNGSYRMTPSGRAVLSAADAGDRGRAGDTISGGRDRVSTRRQRQQAAAERKKKPKAPAAAAGGGKEKPKPSIDIAGRMARVNSRLARMRKRRKPGASASTTPTPIPTRQTTKAQVPARTLNAGHTGVMIALHPDDQAIKAITALDGVTEKPDQLHLTLCFLGDSTEQPLATNKARLIDAVARWAAERGKPLKGVINGLGRFFHAEDDQTNAVYVAPDVPGLPEMRQSLVEAIEAAGFEYSQDHGFTPHITVAYVPLDAPTPTMRIETPVSFGQATLAWGDEQYDFPLGSVALAKSFTVYKSHDGTPRWLARTTTAYRDRDREIIAEDALDRDSQRMTAAGQFGPLRMWHLGRPDPLDAAQPWGPGVDVGDCDFSMQVGRTRVESGTFKSAELARRVAATADEYELSPGFFHPPDQPGADGVFTTIRTFERSLVPTKYGRASNLFTGLTVKEQRMDPTEENRRLKAVISTLGLDQQAADALAAGIVQADKSAQAQGIAYKSDDTITINGVTYKAEAPEPAYEPPPDVVINGVTYKALPPEFMQQQADADTEEKDDFTEGEAVGEDMADMGMDDAQLVAAIADAVAAKITPMFGDMKLSEFKAMMQGMATKSEGAQAEIAALKAAQAQLAQRLAQLTGDQPAVIAPTDLEAALKSTGPTSPNALPAPTSPVQSIAMATLPDLYKPAPDGTWNGWQPAQMPPSTS